MFSKALLLQSFQCLLGGMLLTSTLTSTTFVAAMSIANQDIERYFRAINASQQSLSTISMTEERIAMDAYTYAFLEYSSNFLHINASFSEEKARYGEGKISNVRGKLVHITDVEDQSDDTACNVNILGTRGEPTPPTGDSWIALVRRGRCTFEEKVKNVHAKGAIGVIIYNDKPVMNLEKMQIKGKNRNITAVITYQDIGLDMARKAHQSIDVIVTITEGRSGIRPISSLNRTSVLFVSISFIVLMIISLVWLIFYYIQRFRYLQTKDQQSRHLCSVTKKAIMKIPTKTGKSSDERDADSDCCAICIEAYKPADCIRVLPCKHEFHKNCIDPWLIEHRTCPMCKLDVLKFYGYVVGDQIQSTPSPQNSPANLAPIIDVATERSVPVIVVAVSNPSTHNAINTHTQQHQPILMEQHQQHQQHQPISGGAAGGAAGAVIVPNSSQQNSCCHCSGHCNSFISNNCSNAIANNAITICGNSYCSNASGCIHTRSTFNSNACCAPPTVQDNHLPVLPVLSGSRQVTDV